MSRRLRKWMTEMVTLGPTFSRDHTGIALAIEVAPTFHRPFDPPPSPRASHPDGSWGKSGIAPVASIGLDVHSIGVSGFAAVGADVLPWLRHDGTALALGGQVDYAVGAGRGVFGVFPRLWYAFSVASPYALGIMVSRPARAR